MQKKTANSNSRILQNFSNPLPIEPDLTANSFNENSLLSSHQVRGVGIDIAAIPRIAKLVERYDRRTLALLFTAVEMDWCQSSLQSDRAFALCFAAKEAVGKALRTGLVGMEWNQIEAQLIHDQLTVELSGDAKKQAEKNKIQFWQANCREWDEHVMVHVLAFGK